MEGVEDSSIPPLPPPLHMRSLSVHPEVNVQQPMPSHGPNWPTNISSAHPPAPLMASIQQPAASHGSSWPTNASSAHPPPPLANVQPHGPSLHTSDGDTIMNPPPPPPLVTSHSGRSTPPCRSDITSALPEVSCSGRSTPPVKASNVPLCPPPPGIYRPGAIDTRQGQTSANPPLASHPSGQQTTGHINPTSSRPADVVSNAPSQPNNSSLPTNDSNNQVATAVLAMAETIKGLVTQQQTFFEGFTQSIARLGPPKSKGRLLVQPFRVESKLHLRTVECSSMMVSILSPTTVSRSLTIPT